MSQSFDVAIIGGGIAGISAAYKLSKNGAKCVLLEKSDTLYGRARSFRSSKFGEIDCGTAYLFRRLR